jgi:hypothetical protein
MKTPVVEITTTVICRQDDAVAVRRSLSDWFCDHDLPLCRPEGHTEVGKPKKCPQWALETLYPEETQK